MPTSSVEIQKDVQKCYVLVVLNYILVGCPWSKRVVKLACYEELAAGFEPDIKVYCSTSNKTLIAIMLQIDLQRIT